MIRPVAFRLNTQTAANNYFQVHSSGLPPQQVQEKARKEFDAFVDKLQESGVKVTVIDDTPEPPTPDSVFPNNWVSFHEDQQAVLYPMFAPNRQQERNKSVLNKLAGLGFGISTLHDYTHYEAQHQYLEGTGSMVLDRSNKIAYATRSVRMHEAPLRKWCAQFGYEPVIFSACHTVNRLRVPVYHTNVVMSVGQQFAVICLSSIDNTNEREKVVGYLQRTNKEIIDISEQQMAKFAGNILQLNSANGQPVIAMSQKAFEAFTSEQKVQLSQYGRLVWSDLSTIENVGGGSARCMIAELY